MTPEELQQIQDIIQSSVTAATAPLAQQIQTLSKETKQEIQTLKTEMNNRFDQLEKLTADYLDGEVQKVKRRLDRVERHLNLT